MSWRRPCPSRSRKARGPKERASRLHACRSAQDRRGSCHRTAKALFDRAPHFSNCLITQTSPQPPPGNAVVRSEEHTSELQSLMRISYAVFCLKKKKTTHKSTPVPYSK